MELLKKDQENTEKRIMEFIAAARYGEIEDDIIQPKIQEKFKLTEEEAKKYMKRPSEGVLKL